MSLFCGLRFPELSFRTRQAKACLVRPVAVFVPMTTSPWGWLSGNILYELSNRRAAIRTSSHCSYQFLAGKKAPLAQGRTFSGNRHWIYVVLLLDAFLSWVADHRPKNATPVLCNTGCQQLGFSFTGRTKPTNTIGLLSRVKFGPFPLNLTNYIERQTQRSRCLSWHSWHDNMEHWPTSFKGTILHGCSNCDRIC